MKKRTEEMDEKIKNNQYSKMVNLKADLQELKKQFLAETPEINERNQIFDLFYGKIIVSGADSITTTNEKSIHNITE